MKSVKLRLIGIALLGFFVSTPAQSALVYDWFITNPNQTVAPTDIVSVNGRFEVDISSTESLDLDAAVTLAVASFSPNIFAEYTPKFGPQFGNVLSQFNGIVLNPGDTFDFIFATLVPSGTAADGDYFVSFPGLMVNGVDDRWMIPHPFIPGREIPGSAKITVSSAPPPPNPVPLPAGVWLFGTALVGLFGWRRKRAGG